MSKKKIQIIAVVGPNASGKSSLAIDLSRKYNGEIISADSRQVYKGMDIGSGKVSKKEQKAAKHHLLDMVSAKREYTVSHFLRDAKKIILDIDSRGKLPIVCGGTGFWIDALLFGYTFPNVKPNTILRKKLELKSTESLFALLKKKDPKRAGTIDAQNRRRLIRALEIIASTHKPIQKVMPHSPYDILWIGIKHSPQIQKDRIAKRLTARLRQGMVSEIKNLHASSVSWKRLDNFGLEYRYVSRYLRGMLTKQDMIHELRREVYQYARRQKTWFKRNKKIHWITTPNEAEKLVNKFLSQ